jgi:hypothetical protein
MIVPLIIQGDQMKRRFAEVDADRGDVHAMILQMYAAARSSHLRVVQGGGPSH